MHFSQLVFLPSVSSLSLALSSKTGYLFDLPFRYFFFLFSLAVSSPRVDLFFSLDQCVARGKLEYRQIARASFSHRRDNDVILADVAYDPAIVVGVSLSLSLSRSDYLFTYPPCLPVACLPACLPACLLVCLSALPPAGVRFVCLSVTSLRARRARNGSATR